MKKGYNGRPPHRGAWIEIVSGSPSSGSKSVAPRTGGRGLKYDLSHGWRWWQGRPPHRGAWIEINVKLSSVLGLSGRPPHRGAWIEISR